MDIVEIAKDRADWLIDAAATASQNRILLQGDPESDRWLIEAIKVNAEKAICAAIEIDRKERAKIGEAP